ncbi:MULTISPECIES: sensor histidine kinase [Actinoalloteichus]|uniref:sensor histidine kinase n=1 Tax=Actinoalloteichus TaxID=65496 RepID=UPI000416F962|nr:ATP-binding protein [Actinoalloteichus caeruleus]
MDGRRNGDTRRGELRIYLGAAPGVGKTTAMLAEGHRRRDQGVDVVVGLAVTHDRPAVRRLAAGLEALPVRLPRGPEQGFAELDVAAVLRRRPELVLVDELAHTNEPGSPHPKRWQDVETLLSEGIDVLSTVNIQHLESVNDVVQTITGVRQRETVPDSVVRQAEQIELVDLTPEALRRRMAQGDIYPASRVDAALSHFFRPGNLGALRELALLWLADQVDVALLRYRSDQHITDTWEARERVVAAVSGGPESETLIRRGRRVASRAGADLLVVHVLRGDGLVHPPMERLHRYRQLTADLGGTFHTVVGDDVTDALLDFAGGANATQLVLGASRRSRLARLLREGVGRAVVSRSGTIDVHLVPHREERRGRRDRRDGLVSHHQRLAGWVLAAGLPVVVSVLASVVAGRVGLVSDVVGHLLAVTVVALVGGVAPALLAAVLGGVLVGVRPGGGPSSLNGQEQLVVLLAMVVLAVLVAAVVNQAARLARQAARARTEATLLASYARTVLSRPDSPELLLGRIRESFGLSSAALVERVDGEWVEVAASGEELRGHPEDVDATLALTDTVRLVLRGRPLPAEDQQVLEAAAGQALGALRQRRTEAAATEARQEAAAAELRASLFAAFGYDLRTPLTTVRTVLDTLSGDRRGLSDADRAELLDTAVAATDQLVGMADNLLDTARLSVGGVHPVSRPVRLGQVLDRATAGIAGADRVSVELTDDLPAVSADPDLLRRVVANVLDNALRHGRGGPPPDAAVRASRLADRVELRIVDTGPGLPPEAVDTVFAPFRRLPHPDGARRPIGAGLGLTVARGFVEAMGGSIRAEDTPGGGLTVVIVLPVAQAAPEAGPGDVGRGGSGPTPAGAGDTTDPATSRGG